MLGVVGLAFLALCGIQGPKLLKFVDSDGWVLPPDVPFDTHARLMKTSPVAARVVKELELGKDPRFAPLMLVEGEKTDGIPNAMIDAVMGGLDTQPSHNEFGMRVSWELGDCGAE